MTAKAKRESEWKSAGYVADLLLNSLAQFLPEEREPRFQDARKLLRAEPLMAGRLSSVLPRLCALAYPDAPQRIAKRLLILRRSSLS
jgi:hypothetical protein